MQWASEFGKSYGTLEEFEYRFNLWRESDDYIRAHNASESDFTLGHNFMSDFSETEYQNMLGYQEADFEGDSDFEEWLNDVSEPVANDVDWRNKGAVTGVKDQK